MLVRVQITNTPLSRRAVRLMVKASIVLALVTLFGLNSLFAVVAFVAISKFLSRRQTTTPLPFKKARPLKKKA